MPPIERAEGPTAPDLVDAAFPAPSRMNVARVYGLPGEPFSSEAEMRGWLAASGVDLEAADSAKGLKKLFHKIEKGEARLVFDPETRVVVRPARVAKLSVEVTLKGQQYPLAELCQIFLANKIAEADMRTPDRGRAADWDKPAGPVRLRLRPVARVPPQHHVGHRRALVAKLSVHRMRILRRVRSPHVRIRPR